MRKGLRPPTAFNQLSQMLARRFSLAALLFGVTFVALFVAIIAPIYHGVRRSLAQKGVVSVAASADGKTFAALMGDGSVLVWDSSGTLKTTLRTGGACGGQLAVSADD